MHVDCGQLVALATSYIVEDVFSAHIRVLINPEWTIYPLV